MADLVTQLQNFLATISRSLVSVLDQLHNQAVPVTTPGESRRHFEAQIRTLHEVSRTHARALAQMAREYDELCQHLPKQVPQPAAAIVRASQ
ncbi:MAG: hypothetical protein MHM6MM_007841 [Cercozoa sp. M6MM]